MTVLITFQDLVEPSKQDVDSLQRAMTVGWCVELVRRVGKGRRRGALLAVGVPWVRTGGMGLALVSWLFVFLCLQCATAEFRQ